MGKFLESVSSNLVFVLVCLGIFAGVVVLTALLEKKLIDRKDMVRGARRSALVGLFSAIGAVLMLYDLPLFFAPSFYKLDLGELPVLLCSFYLGPTAGVTCEFMKVFLKTLLKGTSTAFVGELANFVIGCSFVIPASLVYLTRKSRRSALIGLCEGSLAMTIFGSVVNAFYLIPQFSKLYGMPVEAIVAMGTKVNGSITSLSTLVLYAVVPFNLLKGVVDSYLTFLLYKRLEKLLFRGTNEK